MDSLTALKTSIQGGNASYDEVQSVNAMLNRKVSRQPPNGVLEYLDKIICAIVEGANQNLASSGSSVQLQLPKIVFDALSTVFKTWQNAALPTFISGACIISEASNSGAADTDRNKIAQSLPEILKRLLDVLGQLTTTSKDDLTTSTSIALHYSRYIFCSKLVSESATKSLSDENLRRARFYAQASAVDSYFVIANQLARLSPSASSFLSAFSFPCTPLESQFIDAEYSATRSMALSAFMWLADIINAPSSSNSNSNNKTPKFAPSDKESFDSEALFLDCAKKSLRLIAKNVMTTTASASSSSLSFGAIKDAFFENPQLSVGGQARCLIQLAWRGLSRAVPVSVVFRRLSSLGLSSARPAFLFLNCVGLLSEAPASQKRDQAITELAAVYFTKKPAPPLGTEAELKKDFDDFAKEVLAFRASASSSETKKAEMD
jgi:hypothetical protein